jgi:hemerythrin-like domain-containing protein
LQNFTADAHPIHIHEIQFQVVNRQRLRTDREGHALPSAQLVGDTIRAEPWETGFKESMLANPAQVTRVKAKFEMAGRYVWHCHIVSHEDNEICATPLRSRSVVSGRWFRSGRFDNHFVRIEITDMPVTIGKKQEGDFKTPLVLLTACHRRIEHFFSVLIAVTKQAQGGMMNDDQRSALEASLRYFKEAAPRHTQDEEESLFPRLRKYQQKDVQENIATIVHLTGDHQEMQTAHDDIERWIRQWLDHGTLSHETVAQLSETLERLDAMYKKHIAIEEQKVFPLAARVLDKTDIEDVGREMAARRGIFTEIREASEERKE